MLLVSVASMFALTLAGAAGAVKTGTVSSFGSDEFGQLGNGAGGSSATPVAVAGLTGVIQLDGGREHVVALRSDGTVWAWGHNNYGEVGDGTKTNRQSPVQVSGLTAVTAVGPVATTAWRSRATARQSGRWPSQRGRRRPRARLLAGPCRRADGRARRCGAPQSVAERRALLGGALDLGAAAHRARGGADNRATDDARRTARRGQADAPGVGQSLCGRRLGADLRLAAVARGSRARPCR